MKTPVVLVTLILAGCWARAAELPRANSLTKPSGTNLFPDRVLAEGKSIKVTQKQVDQMFLAFQANRAARGEQIPESMRTKIEADILDRLIATQLFLSKATTEDKEKAKQIGEEFFAEQKRQALSEESFQRQLLALGMSLEEFKTSVMEQAVVKTVLDREIRSKQEVSPTQIEKFYADNPSYFAVPEKVRVRHILVSTRDAAGKELAEAAKLEKKKTAEKLRDEARKGADFAELVKKHSDDPGSKDTGGEYVFARAKDDPTQAMVPEFETASFGLKELEISDLVSTGYGYHIIQKLEVISAEKTPLEKVKGDIKEAILQEQTEKQIPEYLERWKKEAGIKILKAEPAR